MGSTIHSPNLPVEFMMPAASSNNPRDIAFKTIPSATKTEIKRVLESAYGFEIEKVRTLNVKGKKKWRGGRLIATRPDYKKAYVTLKENSSISPAVFESRSVEERTMAISR